MSAEKIPVAVCSGTREVIGGIALDAYNLDDGRRVLSQAGMERALGAGKRSFGRVLSRLPSENAALSSVPTITFRLASGAHAKGYEASSLIDICQTFQAAFLAGTLHLSQEGIARAAMALLAGFAKIGVDAWVDETTGYQKYRDGSELGRRLEAYLRDEMANWQLTYKPSLVRALCQLNGEDYVGGRHPAWLRKINALLQDIILGEEVMGETRLRNPNPKHGSNHHQLLQGDVHAYFVRKLDTVELLAKQSRTMAELLGRARSAFQGKPFQTSF